MNITCVLAEYQKNNLSSSMLDRTFSDLKILLAVANAVVL